MEKPSVELQALLEGRRAVEDVSPAVRSWARFFIYQAADEILAMPGKNDRRSAIDKLPGTIRELVKQEILRLWELRK